MKEKTRLYLQFLLLTLISLLIFLLTSIAPKAAGSLFDSPYVVPYSWTDPETGETHLHWTTNESFPYEGVNQGDFLRDRTVPPYWYPGKTRTTGITSALRALKVGEHHYDVKRVGEVPIGEWKVEHLPGACIHDGTASATWHGLHVGDTGPCFDAYYSGWLAYCADCTRMVTSAYVYAPDYVINTIDYMNTEYGYYYICPQPDCHHLENEGYSEPHICQLISFNMYKVVYDANEPDDEEIQGKMDPSYHMYNNETEYEGNPIDPITHLTENSYRRFGYTFVGWNTKPDNSGDFYADGAEIFNLSVYDYNRDPRGTVTLYAQWVPTESTLKIDAKEGSYDGQSIFTHTQGYGTSYFVDPDKVVSTKTVKVSFDTKGGNTISPMHAPRAFDSFKKEEPFKGRFKDSQYEYSAPNGNIDTLTVLYKTKPIILPTPVRPGYTFGGWYEDYDCEIEPVGFGGDEYTPPGEIKLYAKWVNLVLQSTENYVANGKKGAADLKWRQPDDTPKIYKLYRSDDGINFDEIFDSDTASIAPINLTYPFMGAVTKQYTVPYSGFYTIDAQGAGGEKYGSFKGGKGGEVKAKFFLKKGEVISITVGSRNGTNGGGSATNYGNGGGYTIVSSDINGILVIAGGGGGATNVANGEPGGAETSLRADGVSAGENGMAGGGGGAVGGTAGVAVTHTHGEECLLQHVHIPSCYETVTHVHNKSVCSYVTNYYCGGAKKDGTYGWCPNCGRDESGGCPGNPGVVNGLWSKNCVAYDTFTCGKSGSEQVLTCDKDEEQYCKYGYADGEIISSTNAFGGSNYVSPLAVSSETKSGIQEFNGIVTITSSVLGFNDGQKKDGVAAPDLVAPDIIDEDTVVSQALSAVTVKLSFDRPEDHGTKYWWKCESYNLLTGDKMCDSNITTNTLITGVAGYLFIYDDTPTKTVTWANATNKASLLTEDTITCNLTSPVQYLHIAAVDVAGNVGPTLDIKLEKGAQAWPIITDQVQISSIVNGRDYQNVYTSPGGITYVRGDGVTPFKLSYNSYIDGNARLDYQIDEQYFHVAKDSVGQTQSYKTVLPLNTNLSATGNLSASSFVRSASGTRILLDAANTGAARSNACNNNAFFQCFFAPLDLNGQTIVVAPGAAATSDSAEDGKVSSVWDDDKTHSLSFVPDGEAPVIVASEDFSLLSVINKDTISDTGISFSCSDALSGVRSFSVTVTNQDNGLKKTFPADADNKVAFIFDDSELLFDGDVTFLLQAIDNVGNVNKVTYGTLEYDMTAEVKHAGYNPTGSTAFRRLEQALLVVTTRGYADTIRVELPAALQPGNESVQLDYYYGPTPNYREVQGIVFTIPNTCPAGNYSLIVHSYKNGVELEAKPALITITDSDLSSDIRIRIR